MRTGIILGAAALIAMAGCTQHEREPAKDATTQSRTEDEKALQTLRDLGISPTVLLQMVRQELNRTRPAGAEGTADATATATVNTADETPSEPPPPQDAGSLPPPVPSSEAPKLPAPEPAAVAEEIRQALPPPPETAAAAPPVQVINVFYTELAPYGSWVYVAPYGQVWQPTVTVIDPGWRPYCQGGRWLWTEQGWYWVSSYTWGSIAFHYGRWCHTSRHRWIWIPDTAWAPAWVSWRNTDDCVGWAPMPPGAYCGAGTDIGSFPTDAAFETRFGLREWHYTFVSCDAFMADDLAPRTFSSVHSTQVYRGSSIVRDSHALRGGRPVCVGPPKEMIERSSGHKIRPLTPPPERLPHLVAPGSPRDGDRPPRQDQTPRLPWTTPVPTGKQHPTAGSAGSGTATNEPRHGRHGDVPPVVEPKRPYRPDAAGGAAPEHGGYTNSAQTGNEAEHDANQPVTHLPKPADPMPRKAVVRPVRDDLRRDLPELEHGGRTNSVHAASPQQDDKKEWKKEKRAAEVPVEQSAEAPATASRPVSVDPDAARKKPPVTAPSPAVVHERRAHAPSDDANPEAAALPAKSFDRQAVRETPAPSSAPLRPTRARRLTQPQDSGVPATNAASPSSTAAGTP